jgi:hypothetical protein
LNLLPALRHRVDDTGFQQPDIDVRALGFALAQLLLSYSSSLGLLKGAVVFGSAVAYATMWCAAGA